MKNQSNIEFARICKEVGSGHKEEIAAKLFQKLKEEGWEISEKESPESFLKSSLIVVKPPNSDMWQLRWLRWNK